MMDKVTAAQKRFLTYCNEKGGMVSMWPIGLVSFATINRCVSKGLVEKIAPNVGLVKYKLTDRGRATLSKEKG